MSRNSQQNSQHLARLIQELMRMNRGKNGLGKWLIGLAVLAALYLLVIVPVAHEKLGWNLPGVPVEQQEEATSPAKRGEQASQRDVSTQHDARGAVSHQIDARAIEAILNSNSRAVYISPAGLRYTGGSQQGHRLKHLMAHAHDEPNRDGSHGVFDADDPAEVVAIVDEAYRQALSGKRTRTEHEGERTVYEIDLGRRIGYVGGKSGARRRPPHPAARRIRLVVDGKNLITAFPFN